MRFPLVILVTLSCIYSGCRKKGVAITFQSISSPVTSRINKLIWQNKDTVFFCGGNKNNSGFIYRSVNAGKNWTKVFQSNEKSLYDLFFLNDTTAYCSGDKLLLLRSKTNGETWEEVKYDFIPEYFNYVPMRCIFGDEKLLMIVGGENYDNGAVLWLIDGKLKWVWHFDNEFRTGLNFSHDNYHLLGFGTGYKTSDMGYHYSPTSFKGDYITGSSKINQNQAFACGYNGGIYRTNDAGKNWTTLLKPNSLIKKRIHFNAILFKDKRGWAIGNEGLLMKTVNGTDWETVKTNYKSDFLSIFAHHSEQLFITTSEGEIIVIKP